MAVQKKIETRIREHYESEGGEWLIERGKVKEAKLLKAACLEVERLRIQLANKSQKLHDKQWANWKDQADYDDKIKAPLEKSNEVMDKELTLAKKKLSQIGRSMEMKY